LPRARAVVAAVGTSITSTGSACEVVHAGATPNRMLVNTETFRERLTEENQVASVSRVLSKWLDMRTSGAKARRILNPLRPD
jgi:hypothetical protein